MNEGTTRVSLISEARQVNGLHVCENCAAILLGAFPRPDGWMVLMSTTPWAGPCDLCRYTTRLGRLHGGGDALTIEHVAGLEEDARAGGGGSA